MLNQIYIDNIINTALFEDINYIDVTTDNLIDDSHQSSAYFIAKDSGVLCGIDIAARVFELAGGNVETEILLKDGTQVKKGDVIANLKGSTNPAQGRTHRIKPASAYVRHRYRCQQMRQAG